MDKEKLILDILLRTQFMKIMVKFMEIGKKKLITWTEPEPELHLLVTDQ
jgi:hypothetical protein